MARKIQLAVFSEGNDLAHWAIFLPLPGADLKGKIIHATDHHEEGFRLEFIHNFDMGLAKRKTKMYCLGSIAESYVRNIPGKMIRSFELSDELDGIASETILPDRTFKFRDEIDPEAPNCQTWTREFVARLIKDGLLTSDCLDVLDDALRHL